VGHCRRKQRQQIFLFRSFDLQSEVVDDPARDPACAAAPPSNAGKVAVCRQRLHVPAQVCEFLIDSLQRHREVCMCLLEGGGGWMLSSRVSGFHEAQLFVKLILKNERVSVCEPGGCAETNG
jgi:hypothetical protein